MFYQIDERLAGFSANLWRMVPSKPDENIKCHIGETGNFVCSQEPIEGPETDSERFFTMIWNSAKPSRWFTLQDMKSVVSVTDRGELVGDVGFSFQFVRDPKEADGKTKFAIPWEML